MDFEKFLSFSRLLQSFARIERMVPMPATERLENDMEHSYHLALMAWYIVDSEKLDLDLSLVIKYALVHDLVEVYAGDTWVWSKNQEDHESKHEREAAAASRLASEFPNFPELHSAISEYEKRESREAKFVYALDKILPSMYIIEEDGKFWQEHKITFDMLCSKKAPQVAVSPEVEPYYTELVNLIRERRLTFES